MRRRLLMTVLIAVLAACRGESPPAPHASMALSEAQPAPAPDGPGPGRHALGTSTPPAPRATPAPSEAPAAGPATIRVDVVHMRHPASPLVNGYNRNHVHRQFAVHGMDWDATMAQLRALVPTWGAAWLAEAAKAGYPADATPRALLRTGHGPTDGRTDFAYLPGYRFLELWTYEGVPGAWDGYPYDDLRYAQREAEVAGATPLVTVNFGSDTATSAGLLGGYLNGARDPLRAERPFATTAARPDPQAPRRAWLFEIGNEIALPVVVGHDKANTIDEYLGHARPYIDALRATSPHPVKVALSAAVNVYWGGPHDPDGEDAWPQREAMARAFVAAGQAHGVRFEALQYHGYPMYPVRERLAGNAYAERVIGERILPALAQAPWGPIEIWNDEFHAASALPRNTGLYGALYAADSVVTAFTLSDRGHQLIPVTTDFAAWHAGAGNGYDSLYFQDNDPGHTTPIYAFRRLLATRWGDWVLPTEVAGGGTWTDAATNGETTVVTNLHAVAARAADGALHVLVVNRGRRDEAATLALTGFQPARATRCTIGPAAGVAEPWDAAWDQVAVREDEPVDVRGPVAFPRGTITLLTLRP